MMEHALIGVAAAYGATVIAAMVVLYRLFKNTDYQDFDQ